MREQTNPNAVWMEIGSNGGTEKWDFMLVNVGTDIALIIIGNIIIFSLFCRYE